MNRSDKFWLVVNTGLLILGLAWILTGHTDPGDEIAILIWGFLGNMGMVLSRKYKREVQAMASQPWVSPEQWRNARISVHWNKATVIQGKVEDDA